MLFVCLENPEATVFINECVLKIPAFFSSLAYQTNFGNKFDINLPPLTGILHLFIRFGFFFGIRQFDWFSVDAAKNTIQTGDGSAVAALA